MILLFGTLMKAMQSREKPSDLSCYVELDFPHVTSVKAQRISRSPRLQSLLLAPSISTPQTDDPSPSSHPFTISQGGTSLSSNIYHLLPVDLRHDPSDSLPKHLLPLLDTSLPTLFLAECVFCYMQPEQSRSILRWFGERFDMCAGVIYEMCGLE